MSLVFPAIQALQKISNHLTLLIPGDEKDEKKRKADLIRLEKCIPEDWKMLYKKRNSIHTLANAEFCGKWKILKKLLGFWHNNKDKVLVFSHSVRLLDILSSLFKSTSYSVSFLSGQLSYDERQDEVDNFNNDSNKFVFLISTKAGGVGLNITSANKVVIFDPHWNPSYVSFVCPFINAATHAASIRICKPKIEPTELVNSVMSRFSASYPQVPLKKLYTLARFTNNNKPTLATTRRMSVATSRVSNKIVLARASCLVFKISSLSTVTKSCCKES